MSAGWTTSRVAEQRPSNGRIDLCRRPGLHRRDHRAVQQARGMVGQSVRLSARPDRRRRAARGGRARDHRRSRSWGEPAAAVRAAGHDRLPDGHDPAVHASLAGGAARQFGGARRSVVASARGQRPHDQSRKRPSVRSDQGARSRPHPRARDRCLVARLLRTAGAGLSSPAGAPAREHLRHAAVLEARADRARDPVPAQSRHPFDSHRGPAPIRPRDQALRPAPRAAEPERGRDLAAAGCRAGAGRARSRSRGRADDRRRRSQRRRLVAHQPPVPADQPVARPPNRPRHVQHLPCRPLAAAVAARPRLRQRRFFAARHPPPARIRLGPLPDADLVRVSTGGRRPPGTSGGRPRRPGRGRRQASSGSASIPLEPGPHDRVREHPGADRIRGPRRHGRPRRRRVRPAAEAPRWWCRARSGAPSRR